MSRLCLHTITTKPWPIEKAVEHYAAAGVGGISVWQNALDGRDIHSTGDHIRKSGLDIVSYVRGGFFPSTSARVRQEALDKNRIMIDEAQALGAPLLVLVCGSEPGQSLEASCNQIQAGIESLIPHAQAAGVRLAIEPLHPMYADTRSAITTLERANTMAESIDSDVVGVAIDVYHIWWDPHIYTEIRRCGARNNLYAFHVCDWRVPTRDMLNDREIMGNGCIPVKRIRKAVDEAGFSGPIEVEIFSTTYWAMDQHEVLHQIVDAYHHHT